ncbi:MAG: biotin/lipoyl-binding protein [Eubacterium sp.]|nr:biotin/lipoyl-binding protein [Eubacterium sp.]
MKERLDNLRDEISAEKAEELKISTGLENIEENADSNIEESIDDAGPQNALVEVVPKDEIMAELEAEIDEEIKREKLLKKEKKKNALILSDAEAELQTKLDREEMLRRIRFRKKTLRRFAIIFFVALMVLTFFSNTIMNYSLPEVSTSTVFSGKVSQKVRCQGPVSVGTDLDVTVSGTRTVKEVLVEDGDEVKEGDVIMTFDETENTELTEAESTLEDLQLSYDKSQLRESKDYTDDEVSIANAKDAVTDAQEALEQARADEQSLAVAKAERDQLQAAYDAKNTEVSGLQTQVDAYSAMENYDGDTDVETLISQLATAKEELTTLETNLAAKKDLVTELEAKTTVEAAQDTLTEKTQNLESLQRGLTNKKTADSLTAQSNALDDADSLKKIAEQEEKIEKLKAADDSSEIKANGTGVISGITAKAGDKINADTVIANIQLSDSGYEVSCSIPKTDAMKLKVGNEASIENVWDDDVVAEIKSIKADTSDPNQKSLVKFSVKGNVQVGETLQFAVGEKSGKYDTVVPNGAVKEDGDGKYVYVVKVKATPLGNRYIVKKVKVEVVASDTLNSAIQGEVTEYDNVVINASKLLDNGDQVRLSDN